MSYDKTSDRDRRSAKAWAAKTPKPPKKGFSICPDCGAEFKTGIPHTMFCEAHTCDNCGNSYSYVVEKGNDGQRFCQKCLGWEDGE
jgi:transcription elongation factor Elf1